MGQIKPFKRYGKVFILDNNKYILEDANIYE